MAYHLVRGESVPENIKRIAHEQIDAAVEQLRGKGEANRDEAIHEARKNVKKARAVLRLVRPELGGAYPQQNDRLREVGQKLSELRDAGALIGAFDAVRDHYRKRLSRPTVTAIRRSLSARKIQAEQEHDLDRLLPKLAGIMVEVRKS